MRVSDRVRDAALREPRRNWHDRANVLFGLLLLVASVAGVFRADSRWGVATTDPFLFTGLWVFLLGIAESLPAAWNRTAAVPRVLSWVVFTSFVWLVTVPRFLELDPVTRAGRLVFAAILVAFGWVLHHASKP